MKKILVTGGTGFCGSWLLEEYLKKDDVELFATKKWRSSTENVKHLSGIKWMDADITDAYSMEQIIKDVQPDVIHHLAAMSFVKSSWDYPVQTLRVNTEGSLNIFEAVRRYCPDCVIQIAGSSEEYGIPEKTPITEDMPLNPCSPYAVSKVAMEKFAVQYNKSYGLKVVITRAFNHVAPRRGEEFVCSSFAKQIAEIEFGLRKPIIRHGNLLSIRDFTDGRDMSKAYILSIDKCDYGVPYNICSGDKITIAEVLDILLKYSKVDVTLEQDPARMRPSDLHTLQGDSMKFREKTGWMPEYKLEYTLLELLNYWREKLR